MTKNLITNEAEYDSAIAEIEELMEIDPALGTPEGERLDELADMIIAYDKKHDLLEEYEFEPQPQLDQTEFQLNAKQFKKFEELINAPVWDNETLRKLLSRKPSWDNDKDEAD